MNTSSANMTKQLEQGRILPLVFRLTAPAVLAQLITFLYNIVDRMYVARIEGVGMDALAALGIVLPITLILQAFANLVGLGGSPRAGIKLGEGNPAEADRIFNTSFTLLLVLGLFLPAQCTGLCRILSENLCLRHDLCDVGPGSESFYSHTGLFPDCHGCGPDRRPA